MHCLSFLKVVYRKPVFYIAFVTCLGGGCKAPNFDDVEVYNNEPRSFEEMAYIIAQDTVIKKLRDPLNAKFAMRPDKIENFNGKDFTIFSQVTADNGEDISDISFICRVQFEGGEYNKSTNWKSLYLEIK